MPSLSPKGRAGRDLTPNHAPVENVQGWDTNMPEGGGENVPGKNASVCYSGCPAWDAVMKPAWLPSHGRAGGSWLHVNTAEAKALKCPWTCPQKCSPRAMNGGVHGFMDCSKYLGRGEESHNHSPKFAQTFTSRSVSRNLSCLLVNMCSWFPMSFSDSSLVLGVLV